MLKTLGSGNSRGSTEVFTSNLTGHRRVFGEAVLAELVLAGNPIEWIIEIEVGQMSQPSSRKPYPNP